MRDDRRYYGLDALRGVMMLLGIVIHAATFYVAIDAEIIILKDRRTSPVFDVVLFLIHSFRMPLFFLLSGFFGALLVEKYGMAGAYRNRVARIAVPFLLALVTLLPLTGWFALSFGISVDRGARMLWTSGPEHAEWTRRFVRKFGGPSPGHLWFLYYLMMLSPLMAVCAAGRRLLDRMEWSAPLRRAAASPWLPVLLAPVTALILWPLKGAFVFGFIYFEPDPRSLFYYGTFFVVGYLFHGFRGFLATAERHLRTYAAASVLLALAAMGPTFLDYRQGGTNTLLHLVAIVLNALLTWLLMYAAIGVFQRFLDRDTPWVAYVSQSSYWVYLVHMPIVAFAAWGLVDLDAPAVVKFVLAATFTGVTSFVTYHYLVRRTWISVLLNGRRFSMDWPWREPEARAYSTPMAVRSEATQAAAVRARG